MTRYLIWDSISGAYVWLGGVFSGVMGPSCMRSGVRCPCLVLAVRLSCKDSLYRHLGVSPQLRVSLPVVVLDTLCGVLSHQVLDMEITIWRHWSLHCLYSVIACSLLVWLLLGGCSC